MKKIIKCACLALCIFMFAALLASCNDNEKSGAEGAGGDNSNKFPKDLQSATTLIKEKFDFSDTEFISSEDESRESWEIEDTLINLYGIEDEALLDTIDKFVVTYPATNSSKTFALFFFKDGVSAETVGEVQTAVNDVYVQNLIATNAIYDPEQSALAEKRTFKAYDDALLLVIYDTNGNTEILDALNS